MIQNEEFVRRFYRTRESDEKLERESLELARETGHAEGKAEGITIAKKEMIVNMHKENLPVTTISKITKLPISDIEKIINNSK